MGAVVEATCWEHGVHGQVMCGHPRRCRQATTWTAITQDAGDRTLQGRRLLVVVALSRASCCWAAGSPCSEPPDHHITGARGAAASRVVANGGLPALKMDRLTLQHCGCCLAPPCRHVETVNTMTALHPWRNHRWCCHPRGRALAAEWWSRCRHRGHVMRPSSLWSVALMLPCGKPVTPPPTSRLSTPATRDAGGVTTAHERNPRPRASPCLAVRPRVCRERDQSAPPRRREAHMFRSSTSSPEYTHTHTHTHAPAPGRATSCLGLARCRDGVEWAPEMTRESMCGQGGRRPSPQRGVRGQPSPRARGARGVFFDVLLL